MRYLWIILWLILGFFYWYLLGQCCAPQENVPVEQSAVQKVPPPVKTIPCPETGPLSFQWSSDQAVLSNTWNTFKDSLISTVNQDQILQITGLYRAEEQNNSSFENLGLARANQVRQKMNLNESNARVSATQITLGNYSKDCAIDGVRFKSVINTEKIKEIDDRTLIYFPFNSTNKLADAEVESYLNDVADRVKKSGERIRLTGHTDDIGTNEANQVMGQNRANVIKDYLVFQGVSAAKIIATSKGETAPVASNSTNDGRAKNRRTELQIIK